MSDKREYRLMANRANPYGDGRAAERIVGILRERLEGRVSGSWRKDEGVPE
jgi:UDP-N-acetylglucosamine 2-epimerase